MRAPSEKTKDSRGYGSGEGQAYSPRVHVGEFGSMGTTSNPVDWVNGRMVHLLSQGERIAWHILRWNDNTDDVYEQYPLELVDTVAIADRLGIKHPKDDRTVMTSDFLVTFKDRTQAVFSVKSGHRCLENRRTVEKLYIEREYWQQKGVPFQLLIKEQMNRTYAENISQVVTFFNDKDIVDDISVLKHLIARKMIAVDMEHGLLDYRKLLSMYEEEVSLWKQAHE